MLRKRLTFLYQLLNEFTGETPEILVAVGNSFSRVRGPEAAASLSYYALFSLFPLLLVLISVYGFFIENQQANQAVINFVSQMLPNARELIERNLVEILGKRKTIGAIGLIGSLWSAMGFFTTLIRNINRAWHTTRPLSQLRARLMALAMVGMLFVLLPLSLASSALFGLAGLVDKYLVYNPISLKESLTWLAIQVTPSLLSFITFLVVYRLAANASVRWRECLWGALFTAIAWELGKRVFGVYLGSRWANYDILYGSLGTVLALMFWIYVSCVIILLGAHLTAVLDQRRKKKSLLLSSQQDQYTGSEGEDRH